MWRKRKLAKAIIFALALSAVLLTIQFFFITGLSRPEVTTSFKTYFKGYVRHSNVPKILLYTTWFRSWDHYGYYSSCLIKCDANCTITKDKDEIQNSDVVLFHLWDISWQHFEFDLRLFKPYTFPSYRNPGQVWVALNYEAPTMLWGDYTKWNGRFNWTMSYRTDSEVYVPYARYDKNTEAQSEVTTDNFFREKTKDAVALISNCYDENRRYRIIAKLKQYINVDIFGDCGKPCPGGPAECEKLITPYKFLVAFENSNCKDYVTEKAFRAFSNNMIPIVSWTSNAFNSEIVPPHSYINIYDFPTLHAAFNHIKKVSEDESQYNQYFRWKNKYHKRDECFACELCKTIHSNLTARVYSDMHGWLTSDTCKQTTILQKAHKALDRLVFNFIEL